MSASVTVSKFSEDDGFAKNAINIKSPSKPHKLKKNMKFAVYFALVFASSPALIQANDALSGDKDGYVKKKRRYLKSADGIVRRSPNVPSEDKTDSTHIRDDALTSGTETKQRVQDSGSRSGQGDMCEDPYIAYEFTEDYDCHPPYEHPAV